MKCFLLFFFCFGLLGFLVYCQFLPCHALDSALPWGWFSSCCTLGDAQPFWGIFSLSQAGKSKGQTLVISENCFLNREGGGQVYWLKLEWLVCCLCHLFSLCDTWRVNQRPELFLPCSFLCRPLSWQLGPERCYVTQPEFLMLGENNTCIKAWGSFQKARKGGRTPKLRMD